MHPLRHLEWCPAAPPPPSLSLCSRNMGMGVAGNAERAILHGCSRMMKCAHQIVADDTIKSPERLDMGSRYGIHHHGGSSRAATSGSYA